ncbi:hypothetical protein VN0435_14830 [Helicobacter pylori]
MTGKTIKSPKNRNDDTNANGKIFLNMRVILQENAQLLSSIEKVGLVIKV